MDYEPFSERQRKLHRQGQPVIYRYDELPHQFLVQVIRILEDTIGTEQATTGYTSTTGRDSFNPTMVWGAIYERVSYEGGFATGVTRGSAGHSDFLRYFLDQRTQVPALLDSIEIAFRVVSQFDDVLDRIQDSRDNYRRNLSVAQAVQELNRRFRRHDLGYAFEGNLLMRIDSQYLHAEVVDPALQLLNTAGFDGSEAEFLKAHHHFREGRNEEAIVDALKAFESAMKHICNECGWSYGEGATAKILIKTLIDNGLFPKSLESYLGSLRVILESGVPTLRNKNAGHGRGSEPRKVTDSLAAYVLHQTGANIVYLVDTFRVTLDATRN
jgi:hypothetical protein